MNYKPSFAPLFKKVEYHTSLQGTDIAISNLKKFNDKLDENNIIALAFLANNPAISEEEREKYNKQLKEKAMIEFHLYERCIQNLFSPFIKENDNIYRNEDSSINITECNN
jgi:hypothetical protein